MTRVVSFAFFTLPGGRADLEAAMPLAVAAARVLLPEWEVRVHHDGSSAWITRAAAAGHVVAVDCGPARALCRAMMWRMMPMFDSSVDVMIARDIDAVMMPIEAAAVEQWLTTGDCYPLHTIHDHPLHYRTLAGLLGVRCSAARATLGASDWKSWVDAPYQWEIHGADQLFLNDKLAASGMPVMLHQFRGHRKGLPSNTRLILRSAPGERWPWFMGSPAATAAALPFLMARGPKTTEAVLSV